ncbi:MAG: hypothetical protein KJ011_09460 [Burkholderiaceae bacterium]|nr:hypothetical protein [Burkholderiaceae bacterium]
MPTDTLEPVAAVMQARSGLVITDERALPEPLDVRAQRLFASLPYALRMPVTRRRFPHVLNRIAADWDVPARLLHLVDELLIDQRGGREGFPFETVLELTNLREYYLNELHAGMRERLTARATGVW